MTTVRGYKEFSEEEIRAQEKKVANKDLTPLERKKAHLFAREMRTYNLHTLRGDFDSY